MFPRRELLMSQRITHILTSKAGRSTVGVLVLLLTLKRNSAGMIGIAIRLGFNLISRQGASRFHRTQSNLGSRHQVSHSNGDLRDRMTAHRG
jgi:hypothetical protein